MTDRPDQPESPTENLEQVAEPTAVQPVAPAGDTIPTTTPEVLADATGADSGHAPEWPEAPGTGATAAFATGGATPQTPFGPPAPAPAPTPAPDPVGRPQGQPWTASSWGGPGPSGEPWGQPPGQSWGQPPGQSWGQPPRGQQQPWGAPPGWDPYGPPAAHRGVPVPTGPAEAVKSARTLLLVAVGLVVLALFASFIGAVTARWGVIPTGVSVFAGMLNLAALVCGALALWRITGALETLTRKVTGLERD